MKQQLLALGLIVPLTLAPGYLQGATYVWTGTSSSDWNQAENWDPSTGVPGPSDTATVNSGSLQVTGEVSVGSLNLSGGSLAGGGVLTINTAFNWTGGLMSGTGATVVLPGAGLNLSGTADKILASRSVTNFGTAVWSGTGKIDVRGAALFWNEPGGQFEVQNDAVYEKYWADNPGAFYNAGTFRKTGGAGTTTFQGIAFHNTGTVELAAGTLAATAAFNNDGQVRATGGSLVLSGGGTSGGWFETGTDQVVRWTAGTHLLSAGSAWVGPGRFEIAGATVDVAAALGANRVTLASGTLTGAGVLQVTNVLDWTGGMMDGTGATVVLPGAGLNIGGTAAKVLSSRAVTNFGTAVWSGSGNIEVRWGAPFWNQPGGQFEVQNDAVYAKYWEGAAGTFYNAGTFRKTGGAGTTTFQVIPFHNTGTVGVDRGTLHFTTTPSLGPTTVIDIGISGINHPEDYGRITCAQPLDLAGSLVVTLLEAYVPGPNQRYDAIVAPVRGGFNSYNAPGGENGIYVNPVYLPTGVQLVTIDARPVIAGNRQLDAEGRFTLQIQGVVNQRYTVEATVDFLHWTPLQTNAIPASALWRFVDEESADLPRRFYRVWLQAGE